MMRLSAVTTAALLVIAAGCGSPEASQQGQASPAVSASFGQPGTTFEGTSLSETYSSDAMVNGVSSEPSTYKLTGQLFGQMNHFRLCHGFVETSPPSCGEPLLVFRWDDLLNLAPELSERVVGRDGLSSYPIDGQAPFATFELRPDVYEFLAKAKNFDTPIPRDLIAALAVAPVGKTYEVTPTPFAELPPSAPDGGRDLSDREAGVLEDETRAAVARVTIGRVDVFVGPLGDPTTPPVTRVITYFPLEEEVLQDLTATLDRSATVSFASWAIPGNS